MTLTVLYDRDDVTEIAAKHPAALKGAVLAYDLDAHFELTDRGVDHVTPWELIEPGDLQAARQFDNDVHAFWSAHASLPFCGMDLLAMARFRHIACLSRLAWAAFVIDRAIKRFSPSEVVCFDDHRGHGLDQPPGTNALPLLQPLIRGMAEALGISTHAIPSTAPTFVDRAAQASNQPGEPVDLQAQLGSQPYIIFAGSGNDLVRQLPLIRAVQERTEFAPVQLYRAADPTVLERLRGVGHTALHESQLTHQSRDREGAGINNVAESPSIHPINEISNPKLRIARDAFDTIRNSATGAVRFIFANPRINHHWDFIFGEYARKMSAHVAHWQCYLTQHRPELVVANYPAPILEVAVHLNIPALILPHGIMSQGEQRWYASMPQGTIGAASRTHHRRLLNMGIPKNRIIITGDPGMDPILRAAKKTPAIAAPDPQPRILLITSAIAAPAHQADLPQIDWRKASATFRELDELARRRRDWQFTIKPHPRYDQIELYERLQADLTAEKRWQIASDASVVDCVRESDVVVVVNNRSSAIVEASLLDKPVYLLCGDMPGIDLRAWNLHHWPRCATVEELAQELAAIFADEARRTDRAAQCARAAEMFLGEISTENHERCLKAVQQLIGAAPARTVSTEV